MSTSTGNRKSSGFRKSQSRNIPVSGRDNKLSIESSHNAPRQRYKSFLQHVIEPCRLHATRSTEDRLQNPIEDPKQPSKYKPPFRRNFRYFGYPENLNLALNTPPRVRSWGSVEERVSRSKPKHLPFRLRPDEEGFDPFWIGRLLKSSLLLENPGLLPVIGKSVPNLGRKPLNIVHPTFEHTNCVSEVYFPLSQKSRQAFCRINKIVQEIMEKEMHSYKVQNPTVTKTKRADKEFQESEIGRRSRVSGLGDEVRKSKFSMADFETVTAETLFYQHRTTPLVMKAFCVPGQYPGVNKQVYGKPIKTDDGADDRISRKDEDALRLGLGKVPFHKLDIPEDMWEKLAKVRTRNQIIERNRKHKANEGKHSEFDQIGLRNQVMANVTRKFMDQLINHIDAPLPPELYEDNRDTPEPLHDYIGKGELPPQGPFWWKEMPEAPPTPEELKVVEEFIEESKEQHHFTHHLPGLLYMPRHPFQHLELEWMDKGQRVEPPPPEHRKTPADWHDLPQYVLGMDRVHFDAKLLKALTEEGKDLVGPEIYELYRRQHGIPTPVASTEDLEPDEEEEETVEPVKKVRRLRRPREVIEEKVEEDGEYRLEVDLEEVEVLPLPDIRFSTIEFPKEGIPPGLKDDMKFFRKEIERATPIPNSEEEPKDDDDESNTTTNSSQEDFEDLEVSLSHNPVPRLQSMYQEEILARQSVHNRPPKPAELKPPNLKDVFLLDDYTEDIEYLLHHSDKTPKFLQLF